MNSRALGAWVSLSAWLLGCSSAAESVGSSTLRVISGADIVDSAHARLAAPLVVELRDGRGNPVTGQSVTFAGAGCPAACSALLIPSDFPSDPPQETLTDMTDAAGRAMVLVQFGGSAGPASVAISR